MAKAFDTKGITITDVKDSLIDSGIDLDADITNIHYDGWTQHKGVTDISHMIYVHQVPELVAFHALHPDLWGRTLCLLGPTAVGKTEGVRQGLREGAAAMGRTLNLHELHVSQMGPVDALGVPRERDGRTFWAAPEIWPLMEALQRDGHEDRVTNFLTAYRETGVANYEMLPQNWYVHFHDEVTNPSSPQVPHQLFPAWCGDGTHKSMGGQKLVSDFMVVLAGNRVGDGTNSINLAASAVTRMCMIEVVPHFPGWLQNYAFKTRQHVGEIVTKIHPVVIAYLTQFNSQFAPQEMNERSPMDAFPTPRNWRYVSDMLYTNEITPMRPDLLQAVIAGTIGDAATRQFITYVQHHKDVPNVDRLMRGDRVPNFPKSNRPELLAILGTHMVSKLNASNAAVFMQYMLDPQKFPIEMATMTMKQLRPANKLQQLVREWAPKEFKAWTHANQGYVL